MPSSDAEKKWYMDNLGIDPDTLPTIYPDADPENADWTKQSWDLPPYKSAAFNAQLIAQDMTLDHFKTLPVYRHAVRKGLIVNDEWKGQSMVVSDLTQLSQVIKQRNELDYLISQIIGYPAEKGHIGEYIASRVFGIRLYENAAHKGSDGEFDGGPLNSATVNVKWYPKFDRLLNINPDAFPDYYLVLAGPWTGPASAKGKAHPLVIKSVFLLDAKNVVEALKKNDKRIGIATPVPKGLWEEAEVYPTQQSQTLTLTDEQKELLALFR